MRYITMSVWVSFLICLLIGQKQWSAEVLTVPTGDTVVLEVARVPVAFVLAHMRIPDNDSIRQQCHQKLKDLIEGDKVRLKYEPAYGNDAGTGLVHLLKSNKSVNVTLVESGLALYDSSKDASSKYALKMEQAEVAAKVNKRGWWALDESARIAAEKEPVLAAVAKKSEVSAKRKPSTTKSQEPARSSVASARYCAELRGKYYYPVASTQAAKLNKRKVIYYKTEAEAKKAGKKKYRNTTGKKIAQTMENADRLMEEGRSHYATAVDMGISDARDKHYGEAFRILTQAMLIYRGFHEKDESNEKLGETLRICMEMRYGAMKMKRP